MTRQRSARGGTGANMRRLMHHRKAARVLPVPVGARIRGECPRATAGQPSCWGRVGAGKTASSHARTGGWNRLRGDLEGMGRPRSYEGGSACMAVMKSFRNLAVLDTASAFSIDLSDVTVIFAIIPHRGLQLPEPFSIISVRTRLRVCGVEVGERSVCSPVWGTYARR